MRILYVPFFSNINYEGCSIFNAMRVLLMNMVKQHNDVFIHWPVPAPPFSTKNLGYIDHPRVETFPVKAIRLQGNDAVFVPSDLFERFNSHWGDTPIDLILCDKPRVAFWVKMLMNQHLRHHETEIPIMTFSQYALVRSRESDQDSSEDFELAQVLGWFSAQKTVWPSSRDRRIGLQAARRYLRPSAVNRIIERSIDDVPNSIDTDRITGHMSVRSKDEMLINYGSRFAHGYRPAKVFEEMESVFKGGRQVKFVITSPSKPAKFSSVLLGELTERGVPYEAHIPCGQTKFYREASRCHVVLRMEPGYESSLSLREHMFMKLAVVMPRGKVIEPLLEGYPWQYDTVAEARTMLRYLVDHYWDEDVQETLETFRDRVVELNSASTSGERLYHHCVGVVAGVLPELSSVKQTVSLCMDAIERSGKREFTWTEFCLMCKKHTDSGIEPKKHIYFGRTNMTFKHALIHAGWVDDCQGPEPHFVEVK